eukprot:m.1086796 g.1086796  ORF g.1086796 m.1086796 type:complete len:286 (+) comp24280_c0_seq23:1185-2042(+)
MFTCMCICVFFFSCVFRGPGTLTRAILQAKPKSLTVVEKDHRWLPFLEQLQEPNSDIMQVHHHDILAYNYEDALGGVFENGDDVHLIGNLPFGVATPLLFGYLKMVRLQTGPFKYAPAEMSLSFQKEVADRMVAPAGHSVRSRISVMVQHCCDVSIDCDLPRSVFVPEPKVDASVVRLRPKSRETLADAVPYDDLDTVVRGVFASRRKMVRNNIVSYLRYSAADADNALALADIDGSARAQMLSTEAIEALCRHLVAIKPLPTKPSDAQQGSYTKHGGKQQRYQM